MTVNPRLLGFAFCMLASVLPAPAWADDARVGSDVRVTVNVEGVSGELRGNVLALLTIYQRRDNAHTETGLRRLHRAAEEEIRSALQPFGHYQPEIEAELLEGEGGWEARYAIDPGPLVRMEEVEVRVSGPGADDASFVEAVREFPLREGSALRHDVYEQGRLRLESIADRRGYFDAHFTRREVPVDLETNAARVFLHLETGERYRFGPVRFEQDEFSEDLLQTFVPFRKGEPFHSSLLLELQNGLTSTDFFRSVDVDVRDGEAENLEVPIVVTLQPRPRSRYDIGAGYGTDTGPRGTLSWENRRLNDRGHRLFGELQGSLIRRTASLRYTIPYGGQGNEIAFTTGFRQDDPATHRDRTFLLGASLTRDRWGWRESLYVNVLRSEFEVGGVRTFSTVVLPGAEWNRTRSDNPIYPSRGHRLSLEVRGSDSALGSDVSFLQSTLRAKVIRPVGSSGRTLVRAEVGGSLIDDFSQLPANIRYFAGGDRSVRGFGYRSIGPMDEEGHAIGGRHLVTASVEYEHLLGEQWGMAVFYDVGNAMTRLDDRLEQGAGIGGRWVSPIGLVRVDVAAAVSRSGLPLRLHVMFGPDL